MAIKILGTGSYLPPKVVTNDDLSKTLDTNDEWIYSHSGIHSRHIAGDEDCTSVMATKAAAKALESAGVAPEEIGLIVLATATPDYNVMPSTSCLVQNALGCVNAYTYDLSAACSGFVFALEQARGYLTLHPEKKAIVIGAETLSRIVDWSDRGTCILFGDGAGAVVLGAAPEGEASDIGVHSHMRCDGSGYEFIYREGGARKVIKAEDGPAYLKMNGRGVFQFAIKTIPEVIETLLASAKLEATALDLVVPHQANTRILDSAARRFGISNDKFFSNIVSTGNTSGASIAIALDDAVKSGALKPGMITCFVGFGAGLTYGGILTRYPYL